ncbi:hypothetical protein CDAR_192161 [Caerostris darwini]|uniref:Uncharacterized protein n=1 Tax=Caerostris darwini TaxID=1538125 RepID=A0AAV4PF11_9ARAC|nr:hypothetical protein CDAR_192161 [Caerostris darwini]
MQLPITFCSALRKQKLAKWYPDTKLLTSPDVNELKEEKKIMVRKRNQGGPDLAHAMQSKASGGTVDIDKRFLFLQFAS